MKVDKIQMEILKAAIKASSGKSFDYIVQYDEEKNEVYVIDHGYILFKFDGVGDEFFLDTEMLGELKPSKLETVKGLLKNINSASLARLTGERRIIEDKGKKIEVAKIQGENDSFAWINVKLLKYFESDCIFEITSSIGPIYIYEDCNYNRHKFVAMAMPMRVQN